MAGFVHTRCLGAHGDMCLYMHVDTYMNMSEPDCAALAVLADEQERRCRGEG